MKKPQLLSFTLFCLFLIVSQAESQQTPENTTGNMSKTSGPNVITEGELNETVNKVDELQKRLEYQHELGPVIRRDLVRRLDELQQSVKQLKPGDDSSRVHQKVVSVMKTLEKDIDRFIADEQQKMERAMARPGFRNRRLAAYGPLDMASPKDGGDSARRPLRGILRSR